MKPSSSKRARQAKAESLPRNEQEMVRRTARKHEREREVEERKAARVSARRGRAD